MKNFGLLNLKGKNTEDSNLKVFNITVQGASHVEQNKVCQDYSVSYSDEHCSLVIVADGHGADECFRSDIGSKFAVEVAKSVLLKIRKSEFIDELVIRRAKEDIISKWNEKVSEHFKKHPFTTSEVELFKESLEKFKIAYGSTLLGVIKTKTFCLGLQVGDGKCVIVSGNGNGNGEEYSQPMPKDENCFLNETTSLCDDKPINSFRHFYITDLPNAVFIGTDGVDGCFSNNDQLNKLYETIIYSFKNTEFDVAISELEEYLPRLSQKGSKDDISIGAIIKLDS